MKPDLAVFLARATLVVLASVGLSWGAALLLNATGPIPGVLASVAAAGVLFCVRARASRPPALAVTVILHIAYLFCAAILVMYIMVIPYAYHVSWLSLVRAGRPGGVISFLFFSCGAFFTSLFLGLGLKTRLVNSFAAVAFVTSFEVLVIWQTTAAVLAWVGCGLLLLLLLSLPVRRLTPRPRFLGRRLVRGLPILILAGTAAGLLSLGARPGQGIFETRSLDPAVKRALMDAFPDLPVFSSLAGQGFSFDEVRLGEKPRLADTPLFRVTSERDKVIHLRTEIYDTYAANAWSQILISLGLTGDATGGVLNAPADDPYPVTVTVLFDYLPLLPHRLSTSSIRLPGQPRSLIKTGSLETGFTLTLPLLKNDTIVLAAGRRPVDGEIGRLRERIERATGVPLVSQARAPTAAQISLLETYLHVPASISERTRNLAEDLGRGRDRPWLVLAEIYRYLSTHCAYSLKTEAPPSGVDLVDDFLFTTRKGHAAHFATAFTILARLNGIPARFAKGFIVLVPRYGDTVEVKGLNAHAWPEVWFPEPGWTTLEATPALNLFRKYGPEYYTEFNPDEDELTGRQLAAVMGGNIPPPEKKRPDVWTFLAPFLPTAGAASGTAILIILVVWVLRRRKPRRRVYQGAEGRISRSLEALAAFGLRQAIPTPEDIGWLEWGQRFKRLGRARPGRIDVVVSQIQRIYFGGRAPGPRRVHFLRRACRRLTAPRRSRAPVSASRGT